METIITNSVKQTQEIGTKLARKLRKGDIVCLYGNLGSGKTSFVQGLAKGLGISKRIISPTFIIMRSYEIKNYNFYHIDLYRIYGKDDLIPLGITELIKSRENILAIEWAEKLNEVLPQKRIDLHFKQVDENTRSILMERHE
ncbi:MAG: tRNA (adenosine(37)-N6)-threonylcarbamoyltransferase complex ATPase subunit type 1 TsaE [Candidatus Levybacteria bacterium RIFCSPLOWO2_01_FULL_36_13]|nr:MAG: tRNA (adenosine(37)-N6)-threonylcarbamoyltransferase complex ATPase subunit type 1 TsaE [Candidatus Levybacteria bacterium RIFCSPHIGHO2_01_FULL_36_15b]OGH35870.1 MAG: tRNA (adenosine(37)-N6)-threonylcarbamoyltransferase complex ATPase subunit type 1 TsaE [Candidatus Levybacteria bacterium RIFCSPLOWO2_01_FULL_36_13]